MFHIGQKVVCVEVDPPGRLIKDRIYTIDNVYSTPCCGNVGLCVGIKVSVGAYAGNCKYCNTPFSGVSNGTSSAGFPTKHFVPLQEFYENETTINEMVKESNIEIFQK